MGKSYLPERGSPEAEEIIALYPTASDELIDFWIEKYKYSNRNTFTDAVYRTYKVKRQVTVGEQIEKRKAEIESNVPLKINTGSESRVWAIINDTQNPYQDTKCLSLVESFLAELQPDFLLYNGDINDFYLLSKFDKNPERIPEMQSDVNNTKAMFRRHRGLMPNTEMILNIGNHENRLQKFLWSKAGELSSLKCLSLPELFDFKEYGVAYSPYECGTVINDVFLAIHGDMASIHSSYTAKRLFEKHGGCGICGHSHRGGSYYKRDRFGTWGWWENFCLCNLYPDWIKNPNWQQGFSLIHFKGHRFWVEQLPIVGHTLMYGGRLYE